MKQKTKKKLAIAGAVLGVAAIIATGVSLNNKIEDQVSTKSLTSSDYVVAMLNDETGKKESSKNQLVSDYIKVDGLKITTNDKFDGEVQINYFDEAKHFKSVATLDGEELSIPENVAYVRVEIIPNDDRDITLFTKASIVDQVKVSYNK